MKIIHFSDPHAGGGAEDILAYFDKRWVGVFNYRFRRRFRHDLSRLAKGVEYILRTKPDLVVCTGDLTSTGQPGEFAAVKEILAPLRNSDIPVLYMPGNHDCYVPRKKCVAAVKEMFHWLNQDRWQFDELPLLWHVGDIEILAVNSSRPTNLLCSWGFMRRQDRDWTLERLAANKTVPRVFVSHYPLLEDHPLLRTRHRLFGHGRIVQELRKGSLDLSLCGHVHKPYAKLDSSGRGESCAGSITLNGTMKEITFSPSDNTFRFTTVNVDTAQQHSD